MMIGCYSGPTHLAPASTTGGGRWLCRRIAASREPVRIGIVYSWRFPPLLYGCCACYVRDVRGVPAEKTRDAPYNHHRVQHNGRPQGDAHRLRPDTGCPKDDGYAEI